MQWFKQQTFLTVLEAGKSEVRVPAWSGSGKGSQMAAVTLCSRMAERGSSGVLYSFYKGANMLKGSLPL